MAQRVHVADCAESSDHTQPVDSMKRESDLLERSCNNDGVALSTLLLFHEAGLTRYAMQLLANKDDAKDAVQATFAKVITRINSFDMDRRRSFSSWLYRTLRNHIVDTIRQEMRNRRLAEEYQYSLYLDAPGLEPYNSERCPRQQYSNIHYMEK